MGTDEKTTARQRARQVAAERTKKLEDALAEAFAAADAIDRIEQSTDEKITKLRQEAEQRAQDEQVRQGEAIRSLLELGENRKQLAATLGLTPKEMRAAVDAAGTASSSTESGSMEHSSGEERTPESSSEGGTEAG